MAIELIRVPASAGFTAKVVAAVGKPDDVSGEWAHQVVYWDHFLALTTVTENGVSYEVWRALSYAGGCWLEANLPADAVVL